LDFEGENKKHQQQTAIFRIPAQVFLFLLQSYFFW